MSIHRFRWTSLSTRITLGTVCVFLASVWTLAWQTSANSRAELEREIGAQQFALVSALAQQLQSDMDAHLHNLQLVAADVSQTQIAQPQTMNRWLEQHTLLRATFAAGVAIVDADGHVLAHTGAIPTPLASGDLSDIPAVFNALNHATASISPPVPGRASALPVVTMAVPVLRQDGKLIGAMVGHLPLNSPSVLMPYARQPYGIAGEFSLVAPHERLVVAATDSRNSLQTLPPVGTIPALDGFMQGKEGSAVYHDVKGVEVLSSSKHLSRPAWDLVATIPTAEAFAPIEKLRTRLFSIAALVSLMALAFGVPLLHREFKSIRTTAATLNDMNEGRKPQHPLPVIRKDEIGDLVAEFNRLLRSLTERESLLRDIFDTSSVAIFLVDTGSRVTQANQRMAEMFGMPLNDLIGTEYAQLVDPSQRDLGRVRTFALMSAKLETVDVDRLYVRADGSTFWGRLTGRRIYDADNNMLGLVGVIADISERRLTHQFDRFRSQTLEMLARGQPLDSILLQMVLGVEGLSPKSICSCVLLSADGTTLDKSIAPHLPRFYTDAITGLPIGPAVGSCGAAAYTAQRVVAQDISVHPNWEPYRALAAKAGLQSCWSQPILGETGRVLGTFAIYHRTPHTPSDTDITIIEQAAQLASIAIERSAFAQRLQESEEHFRLLTEGVSDVVWRQDRNNVFTYISPADERMRGFKAEEVIGRHVSELMTPQSMEIIRQKTAQRSQITGTDIASNTLSFVLEQKCKNGDTIWTEVRSTAERDAQGEITGYRGITRDITDRRRAQSELQLAASVFTHAQEGIMITAPDGTILEVNAAFTDITGYTREEVVGRNPRILKADLQSTAFYQELFHTLKESGRWHGEIWNRRKDGTVYPQTETISAVLDEAGTLQHYVSLFSDITALKEQQKRLEHVAHFDALTHLPNRVLLADRLQQAMAQAQRRNQTLAVVFLDLDGFKEVNDQHGHAVGDELLIALASRMRAALRDGDTLARLGGDEFVGVLIDVPNMESCEPLLVRLLKAASEPVTTHKGLLQVSASLGVTFYPQSSDMNVDADQLVRQADHAMYQAKLAGKDRFHVFGT
jgi:diguanylate cyclase (GGDEF)-like protein/PAS domain S-box-containing protein